MAEDEVKSKVEVLEMEFQTIRQELGGIDAKQDLILSRLENNPKTDEKGIISRMAAFETDIKECKDYMFGRKFKDKVYGGAIGAIAVAMTWIITHLIGLFKTLSHVI